MTPLLVKLVLMALAILSGVQSFANDSSSTNGPGCANDTINNPCEDVMLNCKACSDALQIGIVIGIAITIVAAIGILVVYSLLRKTLPCKTRTEVKHTNSVSSKQNTARPSATTSEHTGEDINSRERLPTPPGTLKSRHSYENAPATEDQHRYETPKWNKANNEPTSNSEGYEHVHDYLTPVVSDTRY